MLENKYELFCNYRMFFLVLVFAVLSFVSVLHLLTYRQRRKYSHVPQHPIYPGLWWIPGHYHFFKQRRYLVDELDPDHEYFTITKACLVMIQELKSHTVAFFIYEKAFIFSIDVQFTSVVLSSKNFLKPCNPNFVKPNGNSVFGERGILTEPGTEIWSHKRKTMNPAFQKKYLKMLNSEMHMMAGRVCGFIESLASRNNVEVYDIFMKTSLEVVLRCGFDINDDIIEHSNSHLNDAVNDIFACLQDSVNAGILYKLPWFLRESKKLLKKQCNFLRSFLKNHIQLRLKSMEDGSVDKNDILSHIIRGTHKV